MNRDRPTVFFSQRLVIKMIWKITQNYSWKQNTKRSLLYWRISKSQKTIFKFWFWSIFKPWGNFFISKVICVRFFDSRKYTTFWRILYLLKPLYDGWCNWKMNDLILMLNFIFVEILIWSMKLKINLLKLEWIKKIFSERSINFVFFIIIW